MTLRVLGVDGCRDGWVALALDGGRYAGCRVAASLSELVEDAAMIIGVDIPLGETAPGARAAEAAARRFLGGRHVTVFTPPPLAVALAPSYTAASLMSRELTGRKLSRQAWHLLPKMLDAASHWEHDAERFHEVHPECAFAAMAGAPLAASKKTLDGRLCRIELLRAHDIDVPEDALHLRPARADDVLDAAAVAWTAHRIASGRAACLPDPPENDAAGRPVAIWY